MSGSQCFILNPKHNVDDHSIFSPYSFDISTVHSDDWIIDSGATDHMVHSINFFTKITSIAHITDKLPNGESVIVTHTGTVQLSASIVLENVLCS